MTYDYFTINFTSVSGFIFLLIFLYANSSLEPRIKRIFYLMICFELVEMVAYSLELWTTTFDTLNPLRLWMSAVGYSVRPFIFLLMLMLAMRNEDAKKFPKRYFIPAVVNAIAAFSVFFTDIVYSYTPDNQFRHGPLGYITYVVVILYLIILMIAVARSYADRPKLEILIIFAISALLLFGMAVEALYSVRTVGRTVIIMVTIFYYMFFQAQFHHASITKEQVMRTQLEHANKFDGSTGVLNKKAFADAAEDILREQNVHSLSSIGFIFLDLDHLKTLNDTLGHAIGDVAIADAARAIREVCRKTDLVGRFGGDEFSVLLPNVPKERFCECLKEIQKSLCKTYHGGDSAVAASASIGAVYTESLQALTYEQLVRKADEALYEAKALGRNCHVLKEL